MKLGLYSIVDLKMHVYEVPRALANDAVAIRSISDFLRKEKESLYAIHPEDFSLVKVAEFEDGEGTVTPVQPKHVVVDFADLVQSDETPDTTSKA